MSVSVVICAYSLDRWDELSEAVRSCAAQTSPPEKIIVVIDHNDELARRARHELHGAVVLSNQLSPGLSGARNTGVGAATSDIVAFLDDDASAEPDWLERLSAPLRDPEVAGAGGWILPEFESSPPAWFPESFSWVIGCSYPDLPPTGAPLRNPIGTNMAMRRLVFTRVGGFSAGLGRIGKVPLGCEETELSIRYTARHPGDRFVMVREAVVHHRVPAWRLSWHYFWTRCWAEGISKAAVSALVGSAPGLAAERHYVLQSLPRAVVRTLRSLPRRPWTAVAQVVAIVVGTACAAAGLVRGRVAMRSNPARLRETEVQVPDLGGT